MKIFRNRDNDLLYTIEMVKRRMFTEAPQPVASPYLHKVVLKKTKLEDFEVVSEK